jgi:hypothetical protein
MCENIYQNNCVRALEIMFIGMHVIITVPVHIFSCENDRSQFCTIAVMPQHKPHLAVDGTVRISVLIHVLIPGERAGAFSLITSSKEAAQTTLSQLKIIVRPMYSNPPIHGARIVTEILSDSSLKNQW